MVKRTIFFSEKLDSYELIHGTYPITCGFHLKVKVKLFDCYDVCFILHLECSSSWSYSYSWSFELQLFTTQYVS